MFQARIQIFRNLSGVVHNIVVGLIVYYYCKTVYCLMTQQITFSGVCSRTSRSRSRERRRIERRKEREERKKQQIVSFIV